MQDWVQAMFINLGFADSADGECILRFDDTNPEEERAEFMDNIHDIVRWLGYKPSQVRQRLANGHSPCFTVVSNEVTRCVSMMHLGSATSPCAVPCR